MENERAAAAFIMIQRLFNRKKKVKQKYRKYAQMTWSDFQDSSLVIGPRIKKISTHFRDAITVEERLITTMIFFTTGDLYSSLQYLFWTSKQSITKIVCDFVLLILNSWIEQFIISNIKITERTNVDWNNSRPYFRRYSH